MRAGRIGCQFESLGPPASLSFIVSAGMKVPILKSPPLWFFILSCLVTIVGLLGLSISPYDKGGPFPLLLTVSACLAWGGGIATLISSVVLLVAVLWRSALRK
jgi:hypothetical protein